MFSHELNHAFVYIKKINTSSKIDVYNTANRMTAFEFQHIPALKEFSQMFYLNLPEETQARVQETASILKYVDADNYNDVIKELYLYQPINDAKKMANYNLNRIKEIDRDVLRNFVDSFNNKLNLVQGKIEIKKINDIDEFFEYWLGFIRTNGVNLNKKILKLVADKFNINEERALVEMEEGLLEEIFGEL